MVRQNSEGFPTDLKVSGNGKNVGARLAWAILNIGDSTSRQQGP